MNDTRRKTILFGGTFDPVHNGHLIVARAVAESVGAGRVLLIPTGVNPLKPAPVATDKQRLAMLQLATAADALFEISDAELRRKPPSFTIDTIEKLPRLQDERLSLVIGADMLAELPKWRRVDDLLELVEVIVACRPPWTAEKTHREIAELAGRLKPEQIERLGQSVVATPLIDISSTDIRRRIAAGQSVRYLIGESVRAYIDEHRLYRA